MLFEDWSKECSFGEWSFLYVDESVYFHGFKLSEWDTWRLFEYLQKRSMGNLFLGDFSFRVLNHTCSLAHMVADEIFIILTEFDEFDRHGLLMWLGVHLPKTYKYRSYYLSLTRDVLRANLDIVEKALGEEDGQ